MQNTQVCHAMMKFAQKFDGNQQMAPMQIENFTDGLPFANMLQSSNAIQFSVGELERKATKWITKISNLKKILNKIHVFLEKVNEKTDHIKDIDVVQIAKNSSLEHLSKFFQIVVSVLMNSDQKQKYIQMIMNLDEDVQNTFVEIIQNSLDQQLFKPEQNSNILHMEEQLSKTKKENSQLNIQVGDLTRKNKVLQRELKQLRQKLISYEQQYEISKQYKNDLNADGLQSIIDQQKGLIDNLKIKLLSTVRQNQFQLSQLRQEVTLLKIKTKNMDDLQATLQQYKELYNQNTLQIQKLGQIQKQRRKLTRMVQQKDQLIKKLQNQIQKTMQDSYNMQQKQLYMKIQLEKREARFKQLQKQVKTRLKSQPSQILPKNSLSLQHDIRQQQKQQINYLTQELNKTKTSLKQLQKQNIKNRKKIDKMNQLQLQKKKLQKMILEIHRSKDNQIQMLLVSLYQLRNQNIRMFQLIRNNKKGNQGANVKI